MTVAHPLVTRVEGVALDAIVYVAALAVNAIVHQQDVTCYEYRVFPGLRDPLNREYT